MQLPMFLCAGALVLFGLAAMPFDTSGQTSPADAPASDPAGPSRDGDMKSRSVFALQTKTLEGKAAKLSEYDGKVVLIVNVASLCGYTRQYKGLESLYREFKDKDFVILGFPSNDFGQQEPGSPDEIRQFCTSKYEVTFPLFEKVSVKGEKQCELYHLLEAKTGHAPEWNFCKYLVTPDGTSAEYFNSKVTPESDELRNAIKAAIDKRAQPRPN